MKNAEGAQDAPKKGKTVKVRMLYRLPTQDMGVLRVGEVREVPLPRGEEWIRLSLAEKV